MENYAEIVLGAAPDGVMLFMLVLARITALIVAAPIFGPREVPRQVRAFLAVGIAFLVTPLQSTDAIPPVDSLVDLGVMMAGEVIVGLTLGSGIRLLFVGLQISGQVMSQMAGMQLGNVFDTTFDQETPVFSKLLDISAMAVFFLIGGHRQVLGAMMDSFLWMPPGQATFQASMVQLIVDALSQSFVLGLQAGAPIIASLLTSMLVLGLIGRTLPQINIFAVGFSLNTTIVIMTLWISLAGMVWLFQDQAAEFIDAFCLVMGGDA